MTPTLRRYLETVAAVMRTGDGRPTTEGKEQQAPKTEEPRSLETITAQESQSGRTRLND